MAAARTRRSRSGSTNHRASTDRYRRQLFLQAWALVERDYRQPLTLPMVARVLCSSPRQVQRAYAQFAGASFSTHLRVVRLAAAAELLRTQPLAVRDIAHVVGYMQSGQFSRAFTRRYGASPSHYREHARRQIAEAGDDHTGDLCEPITPMPSASDSDARTPTPST